MAVTSTDQTIPEEVVDSSILVVAEGASMATSTVYQASAHANAIALHNSVSSQTNLNILYPAIVSEATVLINNA